MIMQKYPTKKMQDERLAHKVASISYRVDRLHSLLSFVAWGLIGCMLSVFVLVLQQVV